MLPAFKIILPQRIRCDDFADDLEEQLEQRIGKPLERTAYHYKKSPFCPDGWFTSCIVDKRSDWHLAVEALLTRGNLLAPWYARDNHGRIDLELFLDRLHQASRRRDICGVSVQPVREGRHFLADEYTIALYEGTRQEYEHLRQAIGMFTDRRTTHVLALGEMHVYDLSGRNEYRIFDPRRARI